MILTEKLEREFIPNSEGEVSVFFFDEKGEVKAFFPLCQDIDEFFANLKQIAAFRSPKYVPVDEYELERVLSSNYDLMVSAFICKQTLDFYEESGCFKGETVKDLRNMTSKLQDYAEAVCSQWAEMHPLWVNREYKGMHYYGGNPHCMYPSMKYSTGDMFDSVWPRRANIVSMGFGAKDFSAESVCIALVGKKRLDEENAAIKGENPEA